MRYFTLVKIDDCLECCLRYEHGFLRLPQYLTMEASVVQEDALSYSVLWLEVRASFSYAFGIELLCFFDVVLEPTAFLTG